MFKRLQFVTNQNFKNLLLIFCFFIFTNAAIAAHFRYGDISYRVDTNDPSGRTIIFKANTGWASSGTPYLYYTLNNGSQQTIGSMTTSSTGSVNGANYFTHERSFTFPSNGNYRVYYTSGNKIAGLQNNSQGRWYVYTTVNVGSGNSSPVTSLPAVVNLQTGINATFNVPAVDPDGNTLTYRLASQASDNWPGVQPNGFSISSNGQATFNTVGKAIGQLWNAAVIITDSNGASILVDFIMQITQQSNPPQWNYGVGKTPADGFAYQTSPGQTISFPLEAFDTDPFSSVSISASGFPVGASVSPTFGNLGNPINHAFTWTPTVNQFGQFLINFTAQDNNGVTVSTSVSINVSLKPVFDVPPTPAAGVHNIVVSPGTLIQYTVQASDPDPADLVRIISMEGKNRMTGAILPIYNGAVFTPLPSAANNPTSGTFSWTPTQAQWGHKHVIFTAEDSYGDRVKHEVSQLVNTPPVFSSTPILTADVGVPYSHTIEVTDTDVPFGDSLTIQGIIIPSWLTITDNGNGTATLSGTPTAADIGANNVQIKSEDFNHHIDPRGSITQNFTIIVNNCAVNVVTMDAIIQLDANGQATLSVSDIDNGSAASCGIDTIVLDKTNFTCNDLGGANTVTLTVTDTNSNTASKTATVTVLDSILPEIVCPTNIDAGITSDPSGTVVTYTAPIGTDNCTPTTNLVAGLPSGSTFPPGINTVTYQVTDSSNNVVQCSFTITVTLNAAPTATDDTYSTNEDTTVTLDPLTTGTPDSDPENNMLSISSINGEAITGGIQTITLTSGTINIDIAGIITFTPNNDYNGTLTFPYEITDGTNLASALQTITVVSVNDAPTATDDSYTTDEDTSIILTPLTSGIADSDPENDTLSIIEINNIALTGAAQTIPVTNGTVDIDGAGIITFIPNPDYNGLVSFTYLIADENNDTASANQNITVNPILDLLDDASSTDEDTSKVIDVLTNDNDLPTVGTIAATTLPTNGTVVITDPNGTPNNPSDDVVTYTPNPNFNGTDTFKYTICDTNNICDTAEVELTINPISDIGDTVWFDTDGDGIKDASESGLKDATVTLVSLRPNLGSPNLITTTDVNGNYLFSNLPAGEYTIIVDISSVTSGLPTGVTASDLIPTYDFDSVGTANNSTIYLGATEDNFNQDFAYGISSGGTSGGNSGGIESESLGDALTKLYVGRKKNSVPTEFVKSEANLYNKAKMKSVQPYQGKGQTMLDMFPTQLFAGNVANITSPTDILDITTADEVLSVDFSLNGETKGVVLGIKTTDKVYNHTKASCDRLRGAEILNIQKVNIKGYNFLMQGIKQRSGIVEYAISFAAAKNNNDTNYIIQTNWYVNNYTKFNDVYNFQVWTTKPADTQKLVADVLENLQSFIPVTQTEIQKVPETYASKIYRDKGELVVKLRSTEEGNTAEVSMVELYSETANNIKFRNNTLSTEIQQSLRLDIADGYEYDGLVKVENEVEDAFYHADGNWGLDFDKRYTEIKNYFVWNNFDREYKDDEYAINRDVEVKATSDYDYLTVYKALLPGTISADYSEYNYVVFTAKGSGLMELGLIKSSIQDWKAQYRVMVDFSEEEQTYYVPFEIFTSSASQNTMTAEDLTTLTFTFLPVEVQTKELDLKISDVRFTKTAVEGQIVNKIEKFENEFMAYPNPSQGNVNLLLFSETDTEATVTLSDITGKIIYSQKATLNAGKNELDFNFKVKTGVMLLQVTSPENNYGTTKVLFR